MYPLMSDIYNTGSMFFADLMENCSALNRVEVFYIDCYIWLNHCFLEPLVFPRIIYAWTTTGLFPGEMHWFIIDLIPNILNITYCFCLSNQDQEQAAMVIFCRFRLTKTKILVNDGIYHAVLSLVC